MSEFVFDHVNISVNKNSQAAEFFQKVLGFDNGYRPPFPFEGRWLYEGEQALIHIIDLPNDDDTRTSLGHVAFRSLESAETVVERIESVGLKYRQAVVPQSGEVQTFVDLNGLAIEIISPSKANTQSENYELPSF